ncbi:MAG: DNA topoisomerase [Lachnospiraceae bacterium]|nr:DNA topoisomerase [Lachnospiraceae bacterium]
MGKSLFIAEKPSVAREFAKVFSEKMTNHDGYMESQNIVVTWCVGHLVTMSYPEAYDEKYKKWRLDTLPFLPEDFKYEVIPSASKQFQIVSGLLNREDVSKIYVCTDSGREGEYIYRLVRQEAGVHDKEERRVWIDSQTEEEIKRGIKEAKELSYYDNLADSAYLRAKEDYLMGINFSRLLTLRYGNAMASFFHERFAVISVGRVMTCVLGMVVRREREIRDFEKTPFYRVVADVAAESSDGNVNQDVKPLLSAEWKAVEGSKYFNSPLLYKENGFKEEKDAVGLISYVKNQAEAVGLDGQMTFPAGGQTESDSTTVTRTDGVSAGNMAGFTFDENKNVALPLQGTVTEITKKKEKKNPPLLYNLAELQSDCSKLFKISPDETLNIIQELYEKKLVTYPRTDARVLSTAVAKEIHKNIRGLKNLPGVKQVADYILDKEMYKGIEKTKYTNDKKITDHYAVIPTGQGMNAIQSLKPVSAHVYEIIVRRFLAIFLSPAEYLKVNLTVDIGGEKFFASGKYLEKNGYLGMMNYSFTKRDITKPASQNKSKDGEDNTENSDEDNVDSTEATKAFFDTLKKGGKIDFTSFGIREGETSPPKRYNSGSIILAMENAGQFIEDEELREQIKGQGIGTSATRAEILAKLVKNRYLNLNKKTQIITPTLSGEIIYDIVNGSISSLLDPKLTASWEKGLNQVAEGEITTDEYMEKLEGFIRRRTEYVMKNGTTQGLQNVFLRDAQFYEKELKARIARGDKQRKEKGTWKTSKSK